MLIEVIMNAIWCSILLKILLHLFAIRNRSFFYSRYVDSVKSSIFEFPQYLSTSLSKRLFDMLGYNG